MFDVAFFRLDGQVAVHTGIGKAIAPCQQAPAQAWSHFAICRSYGEKLGSGSVSVPYSIKN